MQLVREGVSAKDGAAAAQAGGAQHFGEGVEVSVLQFPEQVAGQYSEA